VFIKKAYTLSFKLRHMIRYDYRKKIRPSGFDDKIIKKKKIDTDQLY